MKDIFISSGILIKDQTSSSELFNKTEINNIVEFLSQNSYEIDINYLSRLNDLEIQDITTPIQGIKSAQDFNLKEEAQMVRDAVEWTIESLFVSKDIDPVNFYFTSTIGELISEYINGRISGRVNRENIELRKSTII